MAAEMMRIRPRSVAAAAQGAETPGPTLPDDVDASGAAHHETTHKEFIEAQSRICKTKDFKSQPFKMTNYS